MREPPSEGLNLMNTTTISENGFEAGWVGPPKAVGACTSIELVKAFGDRIYSIAKHITQNDDAAGDVLIQTFLEVCSDWDRDDCGKRGLLDTSQPRSGPSAPRPSRRFV